ncbi:MAG: GNAT family N-acetyltransferase [Pyrinomonadaceae bacterium]
MLNTSEPLAAGLVTLRKIVSEDEPLLLKIYASTREDELKLVPWTAEQILAFVTMQWQAQTTHYATYYPTADYNVILYQNEPAGRIIVERRDNRILLIDIAVLREFRNRGIGTYLLQQLLDESDAARKRIDLQVQKFSPALRLYERLGFSVSEDLGLDFEMVRLPVGQRPISGND